MRTVTLLYWGMGNVEIITYRGITFRRYPDSPHQSDRRYFKPAQGDRLRGVQALHQEIWKDAHGVTEIPEGHHVHHADHNVDNNDPANLVLIPYGEHAKHHMSQPERIAMSREAIKVAQEAAKKWHASDAGRAWHSEHAQTTIVDRPVLEMSCECCGESYTSQGNGQDRFCSRNCRAQARRLSGVDDETRTCPACGAEFTVNKYAKKKSCSRKCAWVIRKQEATPQG